MWKRSTRWMGMERATANQGGGVRLVSLRICWILVSWYFDERADFTKLTTVHGQLYVVKRYGQQAWLPGQCHRSRTFLGWSDLADTCIIVFVFFAVDMNSSIFPKLVKLKFTKEQLELRVIWFTSNKHTDNRWDSGVRYLKIVKGRWLLLVVYNLYTTTTIQICSHLVSVPSRPPTI